MIRTTTLLATLALLAFSSSAYAVCSTGQEDREGGGCTESGDNASRDLRGSGLPGGTDVKEDGTEVSVPSEPTGPEPTES